MFEPNYFQVAIEGITNIRTVAGLQCEERIARTYEDELQAPHAATLRKSHLRGFLFGFSQALQYFAWAMVLAYGGYLVDVGLLKFQSVFV